MLSRLKKCLKFSPKQANVLNLNDIFKPFYVTLSSIGLFPYSVRYQNQNFAIIRKSIYINILWAVAMNSIMWIFFILHMLYISERYRANAVTDNLMTQINYIFEMLALNIYCVVAYIGVYFNGSKFVDALNMFAKWTENSNNKENILKSMQTKIKLVTGLLALLAVTQSLVNFTRDDTFRKMVLCNFTFNFTLFVQCAFIAYYYIFMSMVGTIISSLTERVKTLGIWKRPANCFMYADYKSAITLKQLELIYIEVYKVKEEINMAFQASLLCAIIQSFHSIVSEWHIIYHGAMQQTLSWHYFMNCSSWAVFQIIKIYALSDCGNNLKVQVVKLGQALHNVPNEKCDLNLLAEIQHFSTLMTYYGGDLTVYGLFSIDATLLFKIMASAAMYLVVLVQLDQKK